MSSQSNVWKNVAFGVPANIECHNIRYCANSSMSLTSTISAIRESILKRMSETRKEQSRVGYRDCKRRAVIRTCMKTGDFQTSGGSSDATAIHVSKKPRNTVKRSRTLIDLFT